MNNLPVSFYCKSGYGAVTEKNGFHGYRIEVQISS